MVVLSIAIAACSAAASAQKSIDRDALKGVEIGVRGCVKAGLDPGSVVLDYVYEIARDGKLLPPPARGLPTALYSFDDASRVLPYLGRTVEVHGRIKDIRDATIAVKPEPDLNGELVAELPNEGKDVKATADEIPLPVGTSGRPASFKTVVLRMNVDTVTQVSASCASR